MLYWYCFTYTGNTVPNALYRMIQYLGYCDVCLFAVYVMVYSYMLCGTSDLQIIEFYLLEDVRI